MKSAEVRKHFIDFFVERQHEHVKSSGLIPQHDPTLLFTNAGMVQFKSLFLGEEQRPYSRAVTSQKCVRAGGKHNDLENVGYTARHHTFFEMLGNFSFGDYFKRDAIRWGWEFLTGVMKLPKDKLWVTVFLDDDEAAALWKEEAGVPADRIVRLGEKDNFWSMGDTGPCGPCSEILIDQGPELSCGRPDCAVGCDCDRYLELWNLVFMQFNRDASGTMTPLPKPSIDTGMGLERLSAVKQGQHNNFHSDLFMPIIHAVAELAGTQYGKKAGHDVSMRVIADHIRSSTFLLADGLLPSNEGRGYVMRRIIRRAARHGKMLGLEEPFLHRLVDAVNDVMGATYPELGNEPARTRRVLRLEEERFSNTLKHGMSILDGLVAEAKASGAATIPGKHLFRLYDTYGFPLDLAGDIARDAGLGVDQEGFDREMNEQKARARASWVGVEEAIAPVYRELAKVLPVSEFRGYDVLDTEATVMALVVDGQAVDQISEGEAGEMFVDRTPCYAESGGQVGDRGQVRSDSVAADILDTQRPVSNLIAHKVKVTRGVLKKEMPVTVSVGRQGRVATMRNHTATHLLQSALREVLGEHVKQAGSLVAPDRLRFDFTHFSGMTPAEIRKIEDWVNGRILENHAVRKREMPIDEAIAEGATALFGEKYGDTVRVVAAGNVSKELCGGTHVDATGEIGPFKVISDSSVAAGVRRIEALTGTNTLDYFRKEDEEIGSIAELLKAKENLKERLEKILQDSRAREKELEAFKTRASTSKAGDLMNGLRDIGGVRVLAGSVEGVEPKDLRTLADSLRDKMGSGALLVASVNGDQAAVVCVVTKDLAGKTLHAGNLLRDVAARVGAKGGGRPDMAQGGLKESSRVPELVSGFYEVVETVIKGS